MAKTTTTVTASAEATGGNAPVRVTIEVLLSEADAKLRPDFTGIGLWEYEAPEDQPILGCEWNRPSDVLVPTGGRTIVFEVSRAAWGKGMCNHGHKAGDEPTYLHLWVNDFTAAIRKVRAIPPISAVRTVEV